MPWDVPTFNAINDRQYIRPTYFNPDTGGIQSTPYVAPPAAVPSIAPVSPMGGFQPGGGDFFAQLAGLLSGQSASFRPQGMTPTQSIQWAMSQGPVTGYGTGGGQGPYGGVSREGQQAMFRGRGQGMAGMQFGQRGLQSRPTPSATRAPQAPMAPKGPARAPTAPGLLPPEQKMPGRFGAPSQVYEPRESSRLRNRFGGRP